MLFIFLLASPAFADATFTPTTPTANPHAADIKALQASVDFSIAKYKSNQLWINWLQLDSQNIQIELNTMSRLMIAYGVNWSSPDLSKSANPVDWTKYTK